MKNIFITFIVSATFLSARAQSADTTKHPKKISDSVIFVAVQQPPTFPGGDDKWVEYVKENLKYPEKDKADGRKGKVYVSFIIEKDGTITNPKVVRGLGGACDIEAIRLVKNSPKWNPAKQNEKPVRFQYNISVEFKP